MGATTSVHRTIDAVWRMESAKVIAALARYTRDVGLAEEMAQDALVAALEQWPADGVPRNPGAWLMTTAKRRAIDQIRRRENFNRKVEEIGRDVQEATPDASEGIDDEIGDDLLSLIFTACHPVLGTEARVALTLKMLGGLKTEEIARAFLVSDSTVAQRIVRAKKALADAGVPFEVPVGDELVARLAAVLEVVYLMFNEGYTASSGSTWTKPVLCEEAMRLGRMLAALSPSAAETHGLVALMEIQASRLRARVARDGTPITLLDQDRTRWDHTLIAHALLALARAEALDPHGTYVLQAAIAACHARAGSPEATDWVRIASLYGELVEATESPIVELNRAVAVSMADGPRAGLAVVDDLIAEDVPALRSYHLVPAVRGDLLVKLGRASEARAEFERAATLTANEQERDLLLGRAADCAGS